MVRLSSFVFVIQAHFGELDKTSDDGGSDILLFARIFPRPFGARKNTTQLA